MYRLGFIQEEASRLIHVSCKKMGEEAPAVPVAGISRNLKVERIGGTS